MPGICGRIKVTSRQRVLAKTSHCGPALQRFVDGITASTDQAIERRRFMTCGGAPLQVVHLIASGRVNDCMSTPSYTADRPCCRAGQACTPAAVGLVAANSCIRGNTCCYSRNAEFPELDEFAIVPRIPLLRERHIAAVRAPSMRLAFSAFSMQACYALKRVANVEYELIKARKGPPI